MERLGVLYLVWGAATAGRDCTQHSISKESQKKRMPEYPQTPAVEEYYDGGQM